MEDCNFCRIVDGQGVAHVLYEDGQTTAFLDANPAIEGHALVAPNAHVEELFSGDASASGAVFRTVGIVARAIDRTLSPEGFSTFYTSGALVGAVDHAHVHLLPRSTDDDIGFALSRQPLADVEGERLAARIRQEL